MAHSSDNARKFLESLHRRDLAILLAPCEVSIDLRQSGFDIAPVALVRAPTPIDEALRRLPAHDRKRIAEAVASSDPSQRAPDDIKVETLGNSEAEGMARLLADLIIHREMMISVATGGDRIQEVDDYYRARDAGIRRSLPDGVPYENPHDSLWDWYNYWRTNFDTYRGRREYIRKMLSPAIEAISQRSVVADAHREPTGWERVDRVLAKARKQLETATAEEDCQAIGLLCREAIISLAQAVFDPAIHATLDGVKPSITDANRMLEAYVPHQFPGESNKEVRAHARASLALALNLQHRRTATPQLAALCVEATASTVAVVLIISGRKI
ncbi:hypothetical protein DLM45_13215 [Hyphomicrobium methylovorum]|uniref:hypothetical protein n=1 Tax=Hyphomicrobium methylovorum TaxID=84 RepID=UPI0015E6BE5D|nr:hypothetical protein [Hyphomicrobium methylovorum]MBA2127173.1 hypothetical protein [Hyphomicrobium methylovorum]